jgi:hypothetical protein
VKSRIAVANPIVPFRVSWSLDEARSLGLKWPAYTDEMSVIVERQAATSAVQFPFSAINPGQEQSYAEIPFTGLSSDYVFRETKRCVEGAKGTKTLIWPGIDIDIPTEANQSKCTPQGTRDAVLAAFRGGAHGVILSRKYSEMKLANLSGAGAAIKQVG